MADKFDINTVIIDAKRVITQPSRYYQEMKRSGGYSDPVIFVGVMAAAMGVITAFLSFVGSPVGMLAAGVGAIVIMPIAAIISSFIGAGILFVIWKLMGSEQNYETAFRCLAGAAAIYPAVAILSIIPYIGSIIGVVWGSFLMIEASVQVHSRERKPATIVFAVLAVLMVFSNISSEYASRKMSERASEMKEMFDDYENLSPEEQGKKLGEFLKGLEGGLNDNK